jgi:hypothetical protein
MRTVFVARWWHGCDGNWSGIFGVFESEQVARDNVLADGWTELPTDKYDAQFCRDHYDYDEPVDVDDYDEDEYENLVITKEMVI